MGKRFAILIGAAALGVMALGAQTAAAGVVKYDTHLTVTKDRSRFYHGSVYSEARKCEGGRRVVLFQRRPGADRKLGADRSRIEHGAGQNRWGGVWGVVLDHRVDSPSRRVYGKVKRKVRDRFVCRADRSPFRY